MLDHVHGRGTGFVVHGPEIMGGHILAGDRGDEGGGGFGQAEPGHRHDAFGGSLGFGPRARREIRFSQRGAKA